MKVKELIEELLKLPEEQRELDVLTEGCDCVGGCIGIKVFTHEEDNETVVVILRDGMQFD